ncbi:ABC-2 family transporter protein [Cytobacillus oceanisediminis]|uniref:ABC-2 family transporter protein n=1 Tax=Cytobacillus oceanisediminis TaxID=665099 RepID=UPI00215B66A6|nr:ABC-2 family transporter protein [Cytobacillus oceanisediminis]
MALYLPFQGIYYIPNAIFIGEISGSTILLSLGIQLFWVGVCYLLLRLVWNRASHKVVVQGG